MASNSSPVERGRGTFVLMEPSRDGGPAQPVTTGRRTPPPILQDRLVQRDVQLVGEVLERVAAEGSALRAAAAIVSARRRFIAGSGTSGAYATLLATQATAGMAHVTLVDTFIRTVDIISEVRDSDVLVAFAFHPYRKATVEFARMFRDAGGTVVAITDRADSPLLRYAHDQVLITPDGPRLEQEPATAVGAVANLIAGLASSSAKGARRRLGDRERISKELGVYFED